MKARLFLLALVLTAGSSSAEMLLFSTMPITDFKEPSALTAYCDKDPEKHPAFECRFQQLKFQRGLTQSEIAEKRATFNAQFDMEKDLPEQMKKLCAELNQPLPAESMKNPMALKLAKDFKAACSSPDRVAAVKSLLLSQVDAEAASCLVLPAIEWRTKFRQVGPDIFKSEPSQQGMCGAVSVETLERKQTAPGAYSLWKHTTRRAYLERSDQMCKDMPEQIEVTYSWNNPKSFDVSCKTISFGFSR